MWLKSCTSLLIINFIVALEVGEICVPSKDISDGVCTLIFNCEIAVRFIRNKNYNQLLRCGFSGDMEVVCCPRTVDRKGTITEQVRSASRIADRECESIVKASVPPLNLNIIGGELAGRGEFPHVVALGYVRDEGYTFECGGSLISNNFVLTAAHCVDTLDRIEPSIVRVGVVDLGGNAWDDESDVRIAEIISHPSYLKRQKYNDLALLRLEKPVEFDSNQNAVCLYTGSEDPQVPLTITGWGTTNTTTNARSNLLLKANVTVVSRNTCGQSYTRWRKLPQGISDEQLCAGDPDGIRDTCQGDSGGPLQGLTSTTDDQYRLVGITSFGRGCGSAMPGVYTRISKYLDWIESIVWRK